MILILAFLGVLMQFIGVIMFLFAVNSKHDKGRTFDLMMMIFFFGGSALCFGMVVLGILIFKY
jgi:hypothetical protein